MPCVSIKQTCVSQSASTWCATSSSMSQEMSPKGTCADNAASSTPSTSCFAAATFSTFSFNMLSAPPDLALVDDPANLLAQTF